VALFVSHGGNRLEVISRNVGGLMYDLIVIGGGPAGTSAAITANREGARVLLLERGIFPRHKVCGEFVSAESLDLLESLLGQGHRALLEKAIRIFRTRVFIDGNTIESAVGPPAASIARLELDVALWQSAKSCGVDSRQRITVQNVSGTGPFCVSTSDGDFVSAAVINASGRWSKLMANRERSAGATKKWIGVKGHFSEPETHPSVDLYFFDGGYCGVQPVNLNDSGENGSRLNACAMVRADVASSLPDVFRRHSQLEARSREWTALSEPVSTFPLLFRSPLPERDGILMAGDAAVFVDPFVGDGISLALRSGALAAECLTQFFRRELSLQDAARSYRQVYQQRLVPVFKVSSMIRRVLALPRAVRVPMTYLVRKSPALSEYVVQRTR
jgi:flavin-dependent dehydrogenase